MGKHPYLAYYITAHGYGHGVRSCGIIRALNELYPNLKVQIVSRLPGSFLSSQTGSSRNPVRAQSFDVGMAQLDSIRVDVEATRAQVEQICLQREALVGEESAYLKKAGIGLIVADIPGIPIEAAARLGIPKIAVGNFGWDWIYSDFVHRDSRWKAAVEMFQEQYGKADLLLRLPFCEEMKAFPRIQDIPLVARPGRPRRSEISSLTGCNESKKWILLSFTTLNWSDDALSRVEKLWEYEFLTVLPLEWKRKNIHALSREQISFSDVIASADAVVSKPGFGILSDCIVNKKPLIYADRTDFLEYPILEDAIRKYLKHLHISSGELYAGDIQASLEEIWKQPKPELTIPMGGDHIAARKIAEFLEIC